MKRMGVILALYLSVFIISGCSIIDDVEDDVTQQVSSQTNLTEDDVVQQVSSQTDSTEDDVVQQVSSQTDSTEDDVVQQVSSQTDSTEDDVVQQVPSQTDSTEDDVVQQVSSQTDSTEDDVVQQVSSQTDSTEDDVVQQVSSQTDSTEDDVVQQVSSQTDSTEDDVVQQVSSQTDSTEDDVTQQVSSQTDSTEDNDTQQDLNQSDFNKDVLTTPKNKVKGWPDYLAIGTVTDNSGSINGHLIDGKVDAIFKYAGNGFGDRGTVVEPTVTLRTIQQAREVESGTNKNVMPVMVVYTANGSGGGVAPEDILDRDNLVKHMRNLIKLVVAMENAKDANHPNPASIVLNADLFGEWQKSKSYGSFQDVYCGGTGDIECSTFVEIDVKGALKEAIDEEVGILNSYSIEEIKENIDREITDDIKGWVTSQNFIVKTFGSDVTFGWVINLWNPGSALWVHNQYKTTDGVWNDASKGVVDFIKWIGAYDNTPSRPDFLAFDKYERDGFGAAGKPYYAFGAKEWNNYLTYVQQISENVKTPAMLWQIPGGHMATYKENYDGEAHLCQDGELSGCFRHLDSGVFGGHSASGGTYFMGDNLIGKNLDEIREDVLDISLNPSVYDGASNVRMLLEQDNGYDWSQVGLEKALKAHVFAILWGGGETTGVSPISTNLTGGYEWLKRKVATYEDNGGLKLSDDVWELIETPGLAPLNSISFHGFGYGDDDDEEWLWDFGDS